MNAPKNYSRLRAALVGAVVFWALILLTRALPPVWDEADSFARADSVRYWATQVLPGKAKTQESPWSESTLRTYFPNTVTREGHPAGYVLLIAAGKSIAGLFPLISEKVAYRFGPILLFACALAAVFYRVEKRFSRRAAFFVVASILLLPRLFVHAQIAFGDSVLLSGWLFVWATFDAALMKKRYAALWGMALGLTFAAKFTGLLAALPFSLYALGLALGVFHASVFSPQEARFAGARILGIGLPIAALTFYLLNPPIWHAPAAGFAEYLRLNTHRGAYNIGIEFLGDTYNLDHSLPWWNGFFWTAITVPAGLLLAGLGSILLPKQDRNALMLPALNFLLLPVVRMFPGLPVHDGVRLFIAAFPFFGILAGVSLAALWDRGWRFGRMKLGVLAVGAVFLTAALDAALFFPQGLSFYNIFIGGLDGASRAGMESTYYWDGLSSEVTDWLNAHTPDGEAVLMSAASTGTLQRLNEWNVLTPNAKTISTYWNRGSKDSTLKSGEEIPKFRWYVLQNRGGGLTAADRYLLEKKKPVLTKTVGTGRFTPPLAQKTPILFIYPYRDFLAACQKSHADKRSGK